LKLAERRFIEVFAPTLDDRVRSDSQVGRILADADLFAVRGACCGCFFSLSPNMLRALLVR
jgi:hypothetical protein